jgi:hypothetical protein
MKRPMGRASRPRTAPMEIHNAIVTPLQCCPRTEMPPPDPMPAIIPLVEFCSRAIERRHGCSEVQGGNVSYNFHVEDVGTTAVNDSHGSNLK